MPKGYDRETGWDELTDPRPGQEARKGRSLMSDRLSDQQMLEVLEDKVLRTYCGTGSEESCDGCHSYPEKCDIGQCIAELRRRGEEQKERSEWGRIHRAGLRPKLEGKK